ncbi:MAG: VOC family protein [Armatimonadota bacterium]
MSATRVSQGFHHLAFKAQDFDASVKFYTEGLGLTVALTWGEGESRAVMLDTGNGNYLEIFAGGSPQPEGVLMHFALRTDDVDGAIQRAEAAGATVTIPPKDFTIPSEPPTPVRLAFCTGPDGEVIEFFFNTRT